MASNMAATPPTLDLSRLAAPVFVEQLTFETILAQMIAEVQVRQPAFDATVDSDPAVKVLQVAAYREMLIRQAFQDGAVQMLVAYATGGNLDHLGALVGVARLVIIPANDVTGAMAVMEGDDALRARIVLAPESFSSAGPELAYVSHAKGASGDVLDASAISPAPGKVLISVLSRFGDGEASPALIEAVDKIVNNKAVRPLNDDVTTASAQIVRFVVSASLVTFSGPDVSVVLDAARRALAAHLAENRKLGRTITRSGITAALTAAGVHRVDLSSPLTDVACDPTQAGWCFDIGITHGGYAA